jgi:hypothetical protein
MEIKITREKLIDMFQKILEYESKNVSLAGLTVNFDQEGAKIGTLIGGVQGIYAIFPPTYFEKYDCPQPEKFHITKSLLETIKDPKSFKGEKIVTLATLDKKVYVRGTKQSFTDTLEEPIESQFFGNVEKKEVGMISKNFVPLIQAKIKKTEFNLPNIDATTIIISSSKQNDKQMLYFGVEGKGEFKTEVTLLDGFNTILNDFQISYNRLIIEGIISNMGEEIVMSIDAGYHLLILHDLRDDIALTYYIMPFDDPESPELKTAIANEKFTKP